MGLGRPACTQHGHKNILQGRGLLPEVFRVQAGGRDRRKRIPARPRNIVGRHMHLRAEHVHTGVGQAHTQHPGKLPRAGTAERGQTATHQTFDFTGTALGQQAAPAKERQAAAAFRLIEIGGAYEYGHVLFQ